VRYAENRHRETTPFQEFYTVLQLLPSLLRYGDCLLLDVLVDAPRDVPAALSASTTD
jgi:hypothetical protein